MKMNQPIDVICWHSGNVTYLTAYTDKAVQWIHEHIDKPKWTKFAKDTIILDDPCVPGIVKHMKESGLRFLRKKVVYEVKEEE